MGRDGANRGDKGLGRTLDDFEVVTLRRGQEGPGGPRANAKVKNARSPERLRRLFAESRGHLARMPRDRSNFRYGCHREECGPHVDSRSIEMGEGACDLGRVRGPSGDRTAPERGTSVAREPSARTSHLCGVPSVRCESLDHDRGACVVHLTLGQCIARPRVDGEEHRAVAFYKTRKPGRPDAARTDTPWALGRARHHRLRLEREEARRSKIHDPRLLDQRVEHRTRLVAVIARDTRQENDSLSSVAPDTEPLRPGLEDGLDLSRIDGLRGNDVRHLRRQHASIAMAYASEPHVVHGAEKGARESIWRRALVRSEASEELAACVDRDEGHSVDLVARLGPDGDLLLPG